MIHATNLCKSFGGKMVLDHAALEARPGEITLLIGPNGAGKTTTLRMLAGLAAPDSGEINIAGKTLAAHGNAYREMFSFLPQNPAFHPRFTGRQILRFYARLRGVHVSRIDEMLDLTGLREAADQPTGVLSGGMRQRLGLALLLLPAAPVLLLDEPGLSLDPEWRETLHRILRREADEGRTVVVTTHLLAEWNGKADRCLLCQGGIIQAGVNPHALSFETDPAHHSQSAAAVLQKQNADTASHASVKRPFRAVILRELRAALINRYLQVFSVLSLTGGIGGVWVSESVEAAAFFALQIALYFVPLFALLVGVSSARMESEEWPVLFSQPVARTTWLLGKFLAGWGTFALLLGLLFVPSLCSGFPAIPLLRLYFSGMGLAAVFVSLGLWVGLRSADRVRALIAGSVVWLAFFLGFDLLATTLAHWPVFQQRPAFWVSLLMLNPVDAFRIQALFALEQIPLESVAKTPLANLWIQFAGTWFGAISALWTLLLLLTAGRRLNRPPAHS